ncbi:RNA polymerase sigma factor SigF [Olsenella intestinalis]|uniref:RNA polymerase sigma factor SigF n=1 Tax=Olsenella intestinalis TaxID=2930083 RepID=UPI002010B907|nr:RNA polymerase sigma factor SigF [Olsenella intestinalis]
MPGSDAARERAARRRASARTPKGKLAWDKERTRELFRLYKEEGDEEARQQLVVSHLNLVRFLASKFKNRGEPLDDLVQVGTIGLIKAIDRFDPARGLEFTTFATPTIMGEIKRHFRDKGWSVRVPRRLQELSSKVNQVTEELTKDLQRSPSVEEIASALDCSVDEVLEAMESSSAYSSVPLEAPSRDDDDAPSVIDRFASEDEDLASSDDRMLLEEAIAEFSPREQEIIRMRFLDGLTQVEIAKRLGISQVQVSRLLRRTLEKVRERIDPEGVMG